MDIQHFHLFPDLPLELRLVIMHHAADNERQVLILETSSIDSTQHDEFDTPLPPTALQTVVNPFRPLGITLNLILVSRQFKQELLASRYVPCKQRKKGTSKLSRTVYVDFNSATLLWRLKFLHQSLAQYYQGISRRNGTSIKPKKIHGWNFDQETLNLIRRLELHYSYLGHPFDSKKSYGELIDLPALKDANIVKYPDLEDNAHLEDQTDM